MAPTAMVSATNLTRSTTAMTRAASDGSFALTLNGASGEMIQITTDLGRDDTITIP